MPFDPAAFKAAMEKLSLVVQEEGEVLGEMNVLGTGFED
jgi:hypothetical protein